jgi:hypothetical protein
MLIATAHPTRNSYGGVFSVGQGSPVLASIEGAAFDGAITDNVSRNLVL